MRVVQKRSNLLSRDFLSRDFLSAAILPSGCDRRLDFVGLLRGFSGSCSEPSSKCLRPAGRPFLPLFGCVKASGRSNQQLGLRIRSPIGWSEQSG